MIDVHGWSKQPYETPKHYQQHEVVLPRYWFGEGIGEEVKNLDITVLGIVKASRSVPGKNSVPVHEVEYGTVTYREAVIPVIAPFPGEGHHWRYYGSPPTPSV